MTPVRRPMLVAMIVACAMFMENLDGTVISTALPQMAVSLGANPIHLSLGITAYILSLAVFIPISGWVADRYGARTVFAVAIGVFTLGSVLCGMSIDLVTLTLARIVQGIGGALMVPVGRLVLLRSTPKSELMTAMAYLMVPAMIGPVVGPVLGGFITTYSSWRWIFLLNVPIGVLGIVLVRRFIENTKEPERKPLDFLGFLSTGAALACLIAGLELAGREAGSPALMLLLLAGGVGIGLGAVWHAAHHRAPLLDLTLFRVPSFAASVWGGCLVRVGVGAMPFLLPLLLQVGFGMTAFASGLLTFVAAAGSMAMKATAAPILRRYGFRLVLTVNAVISAASILACGLFTATTPIWVMVVILLIGGFFRSLQFSSLNAVAYADIPPSQMSVATSVYAMLQQVSLGLGVALGAVILHLTLAWRGAAGSALTAADFQPAFGLIGGIGLLSVAVFIRMAPDAGSEVSGHVPRRSFPRDQPAEGD